jgi:predicted phosphodiesterase
MKGHTFTPQPVDAAAVLSWVHIGDLHMTTAGEQNDLDLQSIVEKINKVFAESIAFVFLPGDIADNGSRAAYAVVRRSLDQLKVPWCAIIGDHDVHERSFDNFFEAMSNRTHYAFTVGDVRFLAMNAFDVPEPPSFTVSDEQLQWVEDELQKATNKGQTKVLLLHCYPSDLKVGGEALSCLIHKYNVLLVDMGHTHYNEISNDGHTLYTATRSTGQIEEGPVGFSITNIDGNAVSWRFVEPADAITVVITNPADARLTTLQQPVSQSELTVRAKIWSETPVASVEAALGRSTASLTQIAGSQVWQGNLNTSDLSTDFQSLTVIARTKDGSAAEDKIQIGISSPSTRLPRDQDNHIGAWAEHGLIGTQLGPNKNGKKW